MSPTRPTAAQAEFADLFRALGVRLPIRTSGYVARGLADGDGAPLFMGVPSRSLSTDRARALAFAAAINAACGVADADAEPVPLSNAAE